ncbi:MAG: pyruvate, phosphate dikinase [Deltaproteobacteria bacterium]|nr:MAG: pyruvate, phosphate dikinase [Deltaproteobacteria bacterium]
MTRYVYGFNDVIDTPEPRLLLGGKGAGLAEMTRLGIPVPPGFTITTEACRAFSATGKIPEGLEAEVDKALASLEENVGKRLGDAEAPLLLSVRSGGVVSMPGMMDTILNLGIDDATADGLARVMDNRRFAFDAYRRFLEMYGDVVLGLDRNDFEDAFNDVKSGLGDPAMRDQDVPAKDLQSLVGRFQNIAKSAGKPFPGTVREQLWGSILAVFESWGNPRAVVYRAMHEIPDDTGTAVNVQAMVFGNLGDKSSSGVAFTRNPSSGDKLLYGEYLENAQGEDVVAGTRTPQPLTAQASPPGREDRSLERAHPEAFAEIAAIATRLETHFKDIQDIEFTVEEGRVFLLQTRSGKRTAHAAVRAAVEMVAEGLIDEDEAVLRVSPESLEQLLHAQLPAPEVLEKRGILPLASGLPASPGAAMGIIALDADEAERLANDGKDVILVRRETSPEDIHGMKAAKGIVTATGGMTSHAAVVARGLGRSCVAGVGDLNVDYQSQTVTVRTEAGVTVLKPGDVITLDGTNGLIYEGALDVEAAAKVPEFDTLMGWADERRRLRVRTNADTPRETRVAVSYGAEGIGLCRTEHMFFAEDRLAAVRCMALAEDEEQRAKWLDLVAPMQRTDFEGMFTALDGKPMTVRLLDWPLHEFLPREDAEMERVAEALGVAVKVVRDRARNMAEVNPMLGHRGVRVGVTAPEIYRMQCRALAEAAVACSKKGISVAPEIMIPVVGLAEELELMATVVRAVVDEVFEAAGVQIDYQVGTMIELPRACLVADDLAKTAQFFSFGTNDLTQTTFGISRDDAGRFLPAYIAPDKKLLSIDPFVRLDRRGVGELVKIACERGRKTRPDLKLGLCGEHGGEAQSVEFCHESGLDYVSCSPPRLPVARLAAAQAAIRERRSKASGA